MTLATEANPRAVAGSNLPPIKDVYKAQNEALPQYLESDTADLVARTAELLEGFDRAPAVIEDAETAGKISDFIAQITKCVKAADSKRVDIKAGPLEAGRMIDGFFQKNILDKLDTPRMAQGIKQKLLERLTKWEKKLADEERARREAAEAALREEQRLAQIAAREAQRKAEEAALAAQTAKDLDGAIDLEEHQRKAAEQAAAAQAAAEAATRLANAKPAEMSTVRGEYGSSSSLRTTWKGRVSKPDTVDLNALRDYISKDAIEKAVNAYAKIHKNTKPIAGVEFFEESSAVVRG